MENASKLREMALREKRGAAIHEASHAVLVRHFGGIAVPQIWRNPSSDFEQKAWLGTCRILSRPGTPMVYARGLKTSLAIIPAPKRWDVYVSLAGFVGEQLNEGLQEPWEIAEAYRYARECGEISKTDLDMMGAEPNQRDFSATVRYLRRYWPEVEQEALYLVTSALGD